nr:ABC transporter permease [Maliibacterium massiliense]
MNKAAPMPWRRRVFSREFLVNNAALLMLALLLAINIAFTPNFLHLNTLWNLISQVAGLAFIAMGMTIAISSGGIDLSAGSMMAISAMTFAQIATATGNILLAALGALIICAALGLFNGYMIAKWKIQPIILTLVMQMVLRGAAMLVSKAQILSLKSVPIVEDIGLYRFAGGMPIQIIPLALIVAVTFFILKKMRFGKSVEAVGDNSRTARLSGISVMGTLLLVYMASALIAGMGGLIELFRANACDPNMMGLTYELNAIASVAIGGTSMKGGRAKVFGSLVGAAVMTLINITVNMNNIPFAFANIVKTVIIIFAVALQRERKA